MSKKEGVPPPVAEIMVRSVYRVSGEDCFVIQSSRTAFVFETMAENGALGPLEAAVVAE